MTRKHIAYATLAVAIILSASQVFAQCWGNRCYQTRGASYASYGAAYRYAATYPRYGAPCAAATAQACAPVETVVEPCEPVAIPEPTPCEPVATTCEPCAPVETTANCETCATFETNNKVQSCPTTGACPLRRVANVATVPVRVVASLLDEANRTRARYGLPALTYDQNLEAGAQYQANHCARIGYLQHGYGAAEILAQNDQGIETAVNQWLTSAPHRALLLNSGYRYAGVAVVRDSQGRAWCAMRFR